MVSIEEHIRSARELIKDIDEKIRSGLVIERQKLIGFSASEASCDLFAALLHKRNLISPGFNVNHRFFASERIANSRFGFEFPNKTLLIGLLVRQEELRSMLCYGKEKGRETVEDAIKNLNRIKDIVEREAGVEV